MCHDDPFDVSGYRAARFGDRACSDHGNETGVLYRGGPELFPGLLTQLPTQPLLTAGATPLRSAGAGSPVNELAFGHCAH